MLDMFTVASVVAGAVTAVGAPLVQSDLPGTEWSKALSRTDALGDLNHHPAEDSSFTEANPSSAAPSNA